MGSTSNEDGSNANAGAAYVFIRNGNNWDQQAYIKASNAGELDLFGHRVFISGDGNTLAVSAVGEDSSTRGINTTPNESATNSGAVYIFNRGGLWGQQAYIKASNTGAEDQFGISVSLSNDGNTLAVGAYGEDFFGNDAGAAYVFSRSGFTWTEQAFIKASNAGSGDWFAAHISLSGDGNTLAVAAQREDSSTSGINTTPDELASNSGAVYVFTRSGVTWTEQAYIKASNSESGDLFGRSVGLSNSGNTMAVGALSEDSSTSGINTIPNELANNSGAAYVFSRTGTSWDSASLY